MGFHPNTFQRLIASRAVSFFDSGAILQAGQDQRSFREEHRGDMLNTADTPELEEALIDDGWTLVRVARETPATLATDDGISTEVDTANFEDESTSTSQQSKPFSRGPSVNGVVMMTEQQPKNWTDEEIQNLHATTMRNFKGLKREMGRARREAQHGLHTSNASNVQDTQCFELCFHAGFAPDPDPVSLHMLPSGRIEHHDPAPVLRTPRPPCYNHELPDLIDLADTTNDVTTATHEASTVSSSSRSTRPVAWLLLATLYTIAVLGWPGPAWPDPTICYLIRSIL
ncbi:hypothetical protein LY76DRAFT_639891 [Colletotrichum caudatum]|nr:hypothetical protein LY76DRAFT_639891 [Colletotrichum caudatum]